MKKRSLLALLIALNFFLASAIPCTAAEPWKEEFDRLCGYTETAGSLPAEELRKILADCDTLLGTLQNLDVPDKKVYVFRLKKCRNFYQYTIDLKNR